MTRLSIVLLAAVMVSALYLVRVQYESRRLFTEIDRVGRMARDFVTATRKPRAGWAAATQKPGTRPPSALQGVVPSP